MKFEVTSIRPKFRNYSLKPNIDLSDPTLGPKIAQAIFIRQNATQFFDCVEKRLLEKLLGDIDFILERGWAKEISERDFYHGHICGRSKVFVPNFDGLFSPNNVVILYHTLESLPLTPDHINRNILSTLTSQPIVVHPKYKFGTLPKYTVDSNAWGLMEYAHVEFKETPDGPYMLKSGKKIDLWGVLYKDKLYRYLQK